MPSQEEFDELKGRIVELENQLKGRTARRDVSSLTPEEMQAYIKVRDILAGDWGDFCGINDCFRCIIARCWQQCLRCWQPCFECTCGPCLIGQPMGGGVGRFGNLGG